jgi:hypothetical protein
VLGHVTSSTSWLLMRQALEIWAAYSIESDFAWLVFSAARTSFFPSLYALSAIQIKTLTDKLPLLLSFYSLFQALC